MRQSSQHGCFFMVLCFLTGFLSISASAQTRVAPREVHQEAFRDSLRRDLFGKVKGYAFVIANRGGIVATASGGWAQAPGDGNLPMKTYIPAGVGSISKVPTGIALLDLLEANLATGQTVDSKLDTPIRFYVPDRWIKEYFTRGPKDPEVYVPATNRLTLRHLLNHRSGLKAFDDGGSHGTKVARSLAAGPNPLLIGTGNVSYLNENITLLLYIIPAIVYRGEVDAIERRNEGKSLREYNIAVAREYGALYERYMRERFFPRALESISPTCRPGNEIANGRYAKEYESKDDGRGATDWADYCRSQGGWYYSAQELVHLARTIEFSDRFIEGSTRNLLYDSNRPNERLVYWRLFSHGVLERDSGGGGRYRAHGGSTRLGSRAILIRLPFGYVGVGITNSPEFNSFDLGNILLDAFAAGTRNWTEWNVDRPGSDLNSILLIADPDLCRARCDAEPNCKAWTYVKPGVQHPLRARCYLKSNVPGTRRSKCCNSGVKGVDYGTDRPGGDYRNFAVGRNDVQLCRFACASDSRCKAWSFVRPGVQGDRARCWLKNRVRPKRKSNCCSSGLSP